MSRRHLVAALCALATPAAWACPTCSCGDYTLTLMGAEKAFAGRLRVALDFQSRSEDQGAGVGRTRLEEDRYTLGVSYSVSPDLTLALRAPYSAKSAESASLALEEGAGLGDVELLARHALGRSGEITERHLWGLQAGVRVPTAEEQKNQSGSAVDIDAQPGTGQWAPSAGLWYGYFRYPWAVQASVSDVYPLGDGFQALEQGNAVLAAVTSQYAFTQQWTVQVGLESRFAARNRFGGVADDDSGGSAVFVAPGVVWSPDGNWLLHVAAQIPVVRELNGEQDERGDIRVGVAFDITTGADE